MHPLRLSMRALLPKLCRDQRELVQRRLQVLRNLSGNHVGIRQISRVLQALVLQPMRSSLCSGSAVAEFESRAQYEAQSPSGGLDPNAVNSL